MGSDSNAARIAVLVMIVTPLAFSTNLVFGRHVIGDVTPFTLAFIRWASVALVLSPLALREAAAVRRVVRTRPGLLLLLGFLGMWLCGAVVYLALAHTTATNATLIYTTSPVFILLIEALWKGRPIGAREIVGSIAALAGVAVIVTKGDMGVLTGLGFNIGDVMILAAAIAWAVYGVLYKDDGLKALSNLALFALVAAAGALAIAPFALWEVASGVALPHTADAWRSIAGIIVFASLMAFSGFQFGVRRLGASLTGIFMYMLPVYGVFLAVTFLGERFQGFHLAGIALVLGGVMIATFPLDWLRRRFGSAKLAEHREGLEQPEGK